jgi:hypothetical protein
MKGDEEREIGKERWSRWARDGRRIRSKKGRVMFRNEGVKKSKRYIIGEREGVGNEQNEK